jgi:hypothetical protein
MKPRPALEFFGNSVKLDNIFLDAANPLDLPTPLHQQPHLLAMNEREILESGLQRVAQLMGIPALELDADGMCTLEYRGEVSLTLIAPQGSGALYLSAALGLPPAGDRLAFYERLLQLNFLLLETHGATLALDDQAHEVHLCYALDLEHYDEERFAGLVGNMLERAARLKSEIHQTADHTESTQAPAITLETRRSDGGHPWIVTG